MKTSMAYIVLTWHVSTVLMVHPGRIFVIEDVTPAELVPALAAALFSWTLLKVTVWPLTIANLDHHAMSCQYSLPVHAVMKDSGRKRWVRRVLEMYPERQHVAAQLWRASMSMGVAMVKGLTAPRMRLRRRKLRRFMPHMLGFVGRDWQIDQVKKV